MKIREFPPIFIFQLKRIDFSWETMKNYKINDRFVFKLELDVSCIAEDPNSFASEDEKIYELCGLFIHAGSAEIGYYFAYFRDELKESIVLIGGAEEFQESKTPIDDAEKQKIEDIQNKRGIDGFLDPVDNQDLRSGWFEFKDEMVRPISTSALEKQFKGTNENAYTLIYRKKILQKSLLDIQKIVLPAYLQNEVNAKNAELEIERGIYYEPENHIDCFILEPSTNLIDVNFIIIFEKEVILISCRTCF